MADMLLTTDELATYLQADVDSAAAALAIQLATGRVQAAAGQRLVAVTGDAFELDGSRDPYLKLPERPVNAVTAVTIDGLPVTDYTTYGRTGRLWRYCGWRGLTITTASAIPPLSKVAGIYDHGYQPGDQRLQLARAVALQLAGAAMSNPSGVEALAIDDYRESWGSAVGEVSTVDAAALRRAYGTAVGSVRLVCR